MVIEVAYEGTRRNWVKYQVQRAEKAGKFESKHIWMKVYFFIKIVWFLFCFFSESGVGEEGLGSMNSDALVVFVTPSSCLSV